ncbi:hypothetical protein [Devosia sp.]|uniref:hypothetical protein n=1 Tax=Devosia sp. TaxID=1871048 RepID=UPI002F2255F2
MRDEKKLSIAALSQTLPDRQQVADAFEDIQNGEKLSPLFVQMYRLLQTFFAACTEVGATGSIVCRP